jgi:hypothetical protein
MMTAQINASCCHYILIFFVLSQTIKLEPMDVDEEVYLGALKICFALNNNAEK